MSQRARILVAEAIGTAILVLGGPGTVIFAQFLGFNIGVLGVALAFGLSLLCAAYLFGEISGCHINPAVTLGMWAAGKTRADEIPWYWGGQVLGGVIGLASLPGSWLASLLVRRLGHKLHIVIIETLIAVGGLSILYHGIRAL